MRCPLHPELDIFLNLDDVRVERCDAKPLCSNCPVVTVYKNRPTGPFYDDDRFGKSFPDLVDPPLKFVLINLGLGWEQLPDWHGTPVEGRVHIVKLL